MMANLLVKPCKFQPEPHFLFMIFPSLMSCFLSRIFLKGIIVEGNYSGLTEIHPAPFNVVLEDDTYKGQMNVGLKLIPNVSSFSLCRVYHYQYHPSRRR